MFIISHKKQKQTIATATLDKNTSRRLKYAVQDLLEFAKASKTWLEDFTLEVKKADDLADFIENKFKSYNDTYKEMLVDWNDVVGNSTIKHDLLISEEEAINRISLPTITRRRPDK